MASGAGNWQRVPLIPQSRQPTEPRTTPVHAALIREWRAQGRALPGVPDREWDALVSRPVWPHG
ncbi:hypothetical protein NX801_25755 [Streptomyces sp. LP05-1]|uniref:Uncharacterized protein n=1 Tax=Streptomyces pyxinae TaxID=2970734 RepID=A0ABT2CR20_9ACTN|nr:hypothetical protein [Streptomyces sp. LP05-1]MCS0638989.1 hypothetical protein [Streptomyces sp. LP05-1]